MECSKKIQFVSKCLYKKNRAYQFSIGLNIEYDQVRIQILRKEDTSLFNEIIFARQVEGSRRGFRLESCSIDNSALTSRGSKICHESKEVSDPNNSTPRANNRNNFLCIFYEKSNYTEDKCWKLHSKP